MTNIVDKRFLPKNQTSSSRQKFIRRYKEVIKKHIKEIISKDSIKNFGIGKKSIKIKRDELNEPSFDFEHGTGNTDRIYIGNKGFHKGQKVNRPLRNQSGDGKSGSNSGHGEQDDFEFVITEKEFSDLFFEDLALPDLVKKHFTGKAYEIKHAGYSRSGGPSSLNIKKTMLNSLGRRLALKNSKPYLKALSEEEFRNLCRKRITNSTFMELPVIRYIEDSDLRFNFKDRVEQPSMKAVMFCLMDVSGSMGPNEKDIAKRFFILLNLFLRKNYETVDVVFIRHTEIAEEVDEKTFFYDRTTGGTVISSGYRKLLEIQEKRYLTLDWNIYVAQVSDGGNWDEDNVVMEDLLIHSILPRVQYFSFINIISDHPQFTSAALLNILDTVMIKYKNFQARIIQKNSQIFEVFRSLFKKKK